MGYKENESVAKKGSLNEVIGVSVKDSAGKLRGKRGAFIGLEEFGSFPNLIELYGTLRPSMEDGDIVCLKDEELPLVDEYRHRLNEFQKL